MPKTFNGYMDNPSDSPSVFTMRSMYKNMYKKKFDELLVREQARSSLRYTDSMMDQTHGIFCLRYHQKQSQDYTMIQ